MRKSKSYEVLAKTILGELDRIVLLKLRELKSELVELREGFRTLKGKQTISGCKTWAEFCANKLHRTKRAVNMLLAEQPDQREETSQSEAKANKPERTIAQVDADNLNDATRRTMAYFKSKPIEERKHAFIAWVKTIAGDLGLSVEIAEIAKAITVPAEDSPIRRQEVM
jgi:hypothetical protein